MAKRLATLSLVASFISSALGQTNEFTWGFNSSGSTNLTECDSYPLYVTGTGSNASSFGEPPYYLIAWPSLGVPTVSSVGEDRTSLTWKVNQPAGATLLLAVVDKNGNTGGNGPDLYSIQSGDSSCLPEASSTNITLWANISTSDTIDTCTPLGLRVYGGQEPYNLSIAAAGSPVVTNVSLGEGNDVYTWPERADPGGQFLVSVVDANGTWGTSTGIWTTGGSTNTSFCPTNPSPGNSANVNQHVTQPKKSNAGKIAAAVVVPVVVLALLVLGAWWWRRRKRAQQQQPEPAFMPEAWMGPNTANYQGNERDSFNPYDQTPAAGAKLAQFRGDYAQSEQGGSSQGGPNQVIYHSDAGGVQEVPPPYIDPSGAAAGAAGGSSRLAPAELLSQATSVTTEPEPQSSDTKHVYSASESGRTRSGTGPVSDYYDPLTSPNVPASAAASEPLTPPATATAPLMGGFNSRDSYSGSRPSSAGGSGSRAFRSLPEAPTDKDRKGKGRQLVLD